MLHADDDDTFFLLASVIHCVCKFVFVFFFIIYSHVALARFLPFHVLMTDDENDVRYKFVW
jgi:hypothetical protein